MNSKEKNNQIFNFHSEQEKMTTIAQFWPKFSWIDYASQFSWIRCYFLMLFSHIVHTFQSVSSGFESPWASQFILWPIFKANILTQFQNPCLDTIFNLSQTVARCFWGRGRVSDKNHQTSVHERYFPVHLATPIFLKGMNQVCLTDKNWIQLIKDKERKRANKDQGWTEPILVKNWGLPSTTFGTKTRMGFFWNLIETKGWNTCGLEVVCPPWDWQGWVRSDSKNCSSRLPQGMDQTGLYLGVD